MSTYITTEFAGQDNIRPRLVRIDTDQSYTRLTSAGFINTLSAMNGTQLLSGDFVFAYWGHGTATTGQGMFTVSVSNNVYTLVPFTGSEGNVIAGANGVQGYLGSFPLLPNKGSLHVAAVENSGDYVTTVSNAAMGQASTVSIPDPGVSTANFLLNASVNYTQNVAGNVTLNGNPLICNRTSTLLSTGLASGGHVNMFVPAKASSVITILDIKVIKSAGLVGGDRLLILTDGTTVFNATGITAALLGTPIFTIWGGTGNPLTASSAVSQSVAGASVYWALTGGTTDYTSGSVMVSVTYAQTTT